MHVPRSSAERSTPGDLGPVPGRCPGGHRRADAGRWHWPGHNHQFFLASQDLVAKDSPLVRSIIEELDAADRWAQGNQAEVARLIGPRVGIPAPILEVALARISYGVAPVTAEVLAKQQRIADAFHEIGLIPKAIDVTRPPGGPAREPSRRQRPRPLVYPHPRRRPLSRHDRGARETSSPTCARSHRPSTSSAITAPCCPRAELRGRLGVASALVPLPAHALPRGRAPGAAAALDRGPHGGDARPRSRAGAC